MSDSMWCVEVQLFCNTDSRLLYSAVLAAEHCTLYSWTLYSALLRRTSAGLPSLDISNLWSPGAAFRSPGHRGKPFHDSIINKAACGLWVWMFLYNSCTWPRVKHAFAVDVGTITSDDLQILWVVKDLKFRECWKMKPFGKLPSIKALFPAQYLFHVSAGIQSKPPYFAGLSNQGWAFDEVLFHISPFNSIHDLFHLSPLNIQFKLSTPTSELH